MTHALGAMPVLREIKSRSARTSGSGDTAFQRVEQELDWEELDLQHDSARP
jgi:hypothetical protein